MIEATSHGEQTVYSMLASQSAIAIDLLEPTARIAVRVSHGIAGRAEASFGRQNWAAKHYWREGEPGAEVTVYVFDEPLPRGRVTLHVPVTGVEAA